MNESRYLGDHESVLETDPNPSVDEGFDEINLELEGAEEVSGYEEFEENGFGLLAEPISEGGVAYTLASAITKTGALLTVGGIAAAGIEPEISEPLETYVHASMMWDMCVDPFIQLKGGSESSYNNFEKRIAYDLPKATYEKAKDVGESAVEFSKDAYDFAADRGKEVYDSVLGDRE